MGRASPRWAWSQRTCGRCCRKSESAHRPSLKLRNHGPSRSQGFLGQERTHRRPAHRRNQSPHVAPGLIGFQRPKEGQRVHVEETFAQRLQVFPLTELKQEDTIFARSYPETHKLIISWQRWYGRPLRDTSLDVMSANCRSAAVDLDRPVYPS